jgi:hypothetical protein
MAGILDLYQNVKDLSTVPANLIGSLFGNPFDPQKPIEAVLTDNQMNYITQKALEKGGEKGLLSYPDYGTSLSFKDLVTKPFTDPTAFSVATTAGSVGYKINPNTGKVEIAPGSFTYDWDGVKSMDFINKGGLMGAAYRLGEKFGDSNLGQKLANFNLSKTLSDLVFTPAGAAEVTPGNVQNQGLDSFNNLVSDTVMAEPNQFQDYPGDKNLGSVQDQNLGFDYNFDENVLKEEEDAQYNLDNKGSFNMDGILQSLGGFAKNTAGRYIGSQALGGAGTMIGGPVVGGIAALAGLLGGRNLFNSPYIGAGAYTMDQYGNMYTADQLNKMNARGGYYSEPARDSRRRDAGIINMIERRNKGLSYGKNRLAQELAKQAKEEAARQSALDAYFGGSDAGADSGRFDGASSRSEYDSNPTGYSGPF